MHRVLEVSNGTVFDEGVLSLLKDEADLRVSAVAFGDDRPRRTCRALPLIELGSHDLREMR